MGKLSKFLFVQEPKDDIPVYVEEPVEEENVNIEEISTENFVDDIYKNNNMSDYTKSIFKVGEIIAALPKEMPDSTKKSTVLQVLSSFGITGEDVCSDARKRIDLIETAREKVCSESNDKIADNNQVINQKKEEIQELEKENAYHRSVIDNAVDVIEQEVKHIQYLISFIGG